MTATIHLEAACLAADCARLAEKTFEQMMSGRYSLGVSVMQLPSTLDEHLASMRTARKRAARADRLGYRFDQFDRSEHADSIHAINTSLPERQGRAMSAGYLEHRSFAPLPSYPCARHAIRTYGVLTGDLLVAYLVAHRVGELVLVSQILGHGDHLSGDIMYLLFAGMLAEEINAGRGFVFYNRHDSGTDGLRYFKERVGLRPVDVEWSL